MAADAVPDLSDLPTRGRARSGAMHSDLDSEMNDDIAALTASLEGRAPPPRTSTGGSGSGGERGGGGASGGERGGGKPGLSKKTINVLTRLDVATAPPEELSGDRPAAGHKETAEEAEERVLAEKERLERERGAAGAGAGASSTAGTAAAAGGSGGGTAASAASAGGAASDGFPPASSIRVLRGANEKEYDVNIKLLLLGDSGVGKTSLINRYSEDKFDSSLLATAGVDYKVQMLDMGGRRVKCQVWDTAGQARFHAITQSYYKNAHGIVLVYDVSDTSEASFLNIKYWMENIAKYASSHVIPILVGNKADIPYDRGKAAADEYGLKFFETSAKDGTGVREAFHSLARDCVIKMIAGDVAADAPAAKGHAPSGSGGGSGGSAAAGAAAGKDGKDGKCIIT